MIRDTGEALGAIGRTSAPAPQAVVACLALGLLLPLLAGGNLLMQLEPRVALPVFLAASIVFSLIVLREPVAPAVRPSPAEWAPLFLLVTWWWGNLLLRPSGPRAALEAQGLVAGALLFLALSWRPLREQELERFVLGIAAGGLVTALYGQYQHWLMFPAIAPSMIAIYGQGPFLSVNANFYSANCYAPFLAATLVLFGALSLRSESPVPRPFLWLVIPLLLVTLVLTQSRAVLALLAVTGFLLGGGPGRIRAQRPIGLVAFAVVLGGGLLYGSRWIEAEELWQTAWLGRLEIWRAAGSMIRDHWLLGVGLGGFAEQFYAYRTNAYYTRYPHNLILEVFAEIGIVGVVALIGFLAAAFWSSWSAIRGGASTLRRSALAAAALLVVHALVDIDWHAPANPILLLVLLAASRPPRSEVEC